jgi:cell division protein FtsZ
MNNSQNSQLAFELAAPAPEGARIRVIGVGGGGGNAINSMIKRGLTGVDFIAANTDSQSLTSNLATTKVQIGRELTRGLGAGADPTIGQLAVEESIDDIRDALQHSDMIFVTAGMGGGTGTGGAPVIARIGRELDCLVVGIVTKPFAWEAKKRSHSADHGVNELRKHVDALIVIPNQRLMGIIDKNTSFVQAFQKVDDVLYNATKGIADIISGNGYVNVDFADVRTIMKNKGDALMGIGIARGEERAKDAALNAIQSPLLDGVSIHGAEGVLINITANSDVSMATVVATGFRQNANSEHEELEQEAVQVHAQQAAQAQQQVAQAESKIAANGGAVHMPAEFTAAVASQQRSVPVSAPAGHEVTSTFNAPAYTRRGGSVPLSTPAQAPAADSRDKSPSEKPAFLRKIMD